MLVRPNASAAAAAEGGGYADLILLPFPHLLSLYHFQYTHVYRMVTYKSASSASHNLRPGGGARGWGMIWMI